MNILNLYLNSFILISVSLIGSVFSGAVQLNSNNIDTILGNNELVFINFYANWCRFSQMLEPIFDEFADKITSNAEYTTGKVAIAKVDCDTETGIATKNHINKYPTLKLYRYGVPVKKEYRGARSVDAFVNYIKDQMATTYQLVRSLGELSTVETKKRTIIGYFENDQSESYKVYVKLTSILRDSCHFVIAIGDAFSTQRANGDSIVFRNSGADTQNDKPYAGDLHQYDALYAWANEKCTPLVREITFENAEELTEEGLPFLILFHNPDETESIKLFEKEVQRQLAHEKNTINAVHADGLKFSHPLHHLGKSSSDLPVLAIDSFRHMYLFPDFKKLGEGNHLNQFVQDLHSGKLHREFHNGPDPTEAPKPQEIELIVNKQADHIPIIPDSHNQKHDIRSTPPESVFIKLAPSRERYSIKNDGDL